MSSYSTSGGKISETLELDTQNGGISNSEDTHVGKTLDLDTPKGKTLELDNNHVGESIELDEEIDLACNSCSVPGFLTRVLREELDDDNGRNHKLLVIAIHAVLLESGLVVFDPSSKTTNYQSHVPEEWPTDSLRMSLRYTLPEIINNGGGGDDTLNIHHALLKFNNIGKFVDVYGSLPNETGVHWVRLEEDKLVPFLSVIWANCGLLDEEDGVFGTSQPEKEVFEFWRRVKDRLALPLLIDLCERAGLELPPCFMRLPTDVKLKIMELLPGVDVAKVGSLCSELRYLTGSEDLWKQKYEEEQFVSAERLMVMENWKEGFKMSWKERFKMSWDNRKRLKSLSARPPFFQQERRQYPPWFIGGGRNPFPAPPYINDDPCDILPRPFRIDSETQPCMPGLALPRRRNTPHFHFNLGEPDIWSLG